MGFSVPVKASPSVIVRSWRISAPRAWPCWPPPRARPPPRISLNISSKISANPPAKSKPAAAETASPWAALLERGMAEPVIGGALLPVAEDGIGFVDVLELGFRRMVAPGLRSG